MKELVKKYENDFNTDSIFMGNVDRLVHYNIVLEEDLRFFLFGKISIFMNARFW